MKIHTDLQIERIDKKSISFDTKVSDMKSSLTKVEDSLADNGILLEPTEQVGWTYPDDVVELQDPEEGELFHTDDEMPPPEDEEVDTSNQQGSEDRSQGEDGVPNRLSLTQNYIPAGEESEGAASSQESLAGEITTETGLAEFFQNLSYRSTNPELAQPVEEEDWGDIPPVELADQTASHPSQNTRFERRQGYLQRRRERRRLERRERSQNNYYTNYYF